METWRSDQFRQRVCNQLNETFSRTGNPLPKNVQEIEKSIFEAAKSKENYMNLLQNLMRRAKQQAQRAMAAGAMMRPPMQPTQNMQTVGQVAQGAQVQPGMQMQTMKQFNPGSMPRGPLSDSPGNVSMQSPLSSGGVTGFSPDNRMPHPSPGSQYYSQRPQMINRPQQPQSVPQPQLKMPDSTYINTPQASTFIPSLSPAHPSNSPQVSAMSPALRTPGSVSIAHSPAGAVPSPSQNLNNPVQSEEVMYMEKLKQLQKYIEPLSRMINKEKNSKDLSKMKSLRDILMDPTKRLAMATLLKCEKVLINWLDDKTVPTPPPPRPDQHMCQPILDAVATAIKSPMLNHTLKRTFGPSLQVLNGDYYVPESSCTKRARIQRPLGDDNDSSEFPALIKVPNVVQGEIARLGSKFKVTVDQSQSSSYGKLHLICRLDNQTLPFVPSIRILVPSAYPKEGPEWCKSDSESGGESETDNPDDGEGIKQSEFLLKLKPNMEKHINHAIDHNESISAILTAWERSVKETLASQVTVKG